MLKYAEVTRSTFYYQLNRMKEPDKYKEIKEQITAIYHENKGRYGYRRMTMELHNRGFEMYKFRSMAVQKPSEEKKAWTVKDDPRVTWIGKIIRIY